MAELSMFDAWIFYIGALHKWFVVNVPSAKSDSVSNVPFPAFL
jgi:hypothetical protein